VKLISSSWEQGAEIPTRHTCEGENISPPLSWSATPDNTRSLAFIVDDPDAPDPQAPRMVFVHWVLYNIPPNVTQLPEAMPHLPSGAIAGMNDFQNTRYGGPCPPIGRHRYFFKLYALDCMLPNAGAISKKQLEKAMQGHILAQVELMGTYQKH